MIKARSSRQRCGRPVAWPLDIAYDIDDVVVEDKVIREEERDEVRMPSRTSGCKEDGDDLGDLGDLCDPREEADTALGI